MSPDPDARASRIEPWPVGLAALLLTVMAVITTFAVIAGRNADPLVVEDAYEAGRRINEQIRADRAARALGVDLDVVVVREADSGVGVSVRAIGPDGTPVAVDTVRVRRERPTEGSLDQDFELVRAESRHRGHIPLPRAGRWHLIVVATVDGHEIREIHGLGG
ncbi:MAG: FixH family protein [Myxococcota bacterium]|nr:FixH family protein [Myxococcota bacterium]